MVKDLNSLKGELYKRRMMKSNRKMYQRGCHGFQSGVAQLGLSNRQHKT